MSTNDLILSTSGSIETDPGVTWKTNSFIGSLGRTTYISSTSTYVMTNNNGSVQGYILTSSDGGTTWIPRLTPLNRVNDLVWTGSVLVVVGNNGTIATSSDTINWTSRTSGTTNTLNSIIWTGTTLVAVGAAGTVLTSTDGTTWTSRTSGTSNSLYSIAYSGSLFVAGGDQGTVLTSTDGVTWTPRTSGTSQRILDISWSGSIFIASCTLTTSGPLNISSTDGITWGSTFVNIKGNIYSSSLGLYVVVTAAGGIRTSTDGTIWTGRTSGTNNSLNSITWTGATLVAVGAAGTVLTSTDGITWTSRTSGTSNSLNSITWTGSTLVAVGAAGTVLTSTDGITWTGRTSGTSVEFTNITYGNGIVAAVGTNATIISSSDNGSNWTLVSALSVVSTFSVQLAISYGNGIFLVAGPGGLRASSTNGTTWTVINPGVSQYLSRRRYYSDLNKYVAVSNYLNTSGSLFTSSDGIYYTLTSNISGSGLNDVIWTGTQYLAVGVSGTILTSPDGITWTGRTSGTANALNGAVWSGSQFVVVGNSGTVITSTDGVTWTSRTSGVVNSLSSIAYGNSLFVASRGINTANNQVITSTDGITWTVRGSPLTQLVNRVIWTNSMFIGMSLSSGTSGLITSTDGITWSNNFAGSIYDIEYGNGVYVGCKVQGISTSANLTNWTTNVANLEIQSSNPTNPIWNGTKWIVNTGPFSTATYTSTNNTTWSEASREDSFTDLMWTGSKWIATGIKNSIYTSTDNISWTLVPTNLPYAASPYLLAICSGSSSNILVVGEGSRIHISSDGGNTWSAVSDSFGSISVFKNAAPSSGVMMISDSWSSYSPRSVVSSDQGITWKPINTFSVAVNGTLSSANNRFISAGGGVASFTADNGTTSQTVLSGKDFYSTVYSSSLGLFVITSSDGVYTTTNKSTFTKVLTPPAGVTLSSVIWTGSIFIVSGTVGTVYTSPDGTTWTSRNTGVTVSLNLYYGGGLIFAFGSGGTLLTSTDGITWVLRTTGTTSTINSIAYNGTIFKAVGPNELELTSTNGTVWSIDYEGSGTILDTIHISSLGLHVSVGQSGLIKISTNGTTWITRISGVSADLLGVTYGGGVFVVVGTGGTILTSTDGVTWTSRTSGTSGSLLTVAYSPTLGTYVIGGGDLASPTVIQLYTSTDAITWTARDSSPTTSGHIITKIIWGNSEFIGCGTSGRIWRSSNGTTWTLIASSTGNTLYGIAWNGSLYAAVGSTIVTRSSDGASWTGVVIPNDPVLGGPGLRKIINGGSTFVATGKASFYDQGIVYTSADAITWTRSTLPIVIAANTYTFPGLVPAISWTGSTYYLSGMGGYILQSTNATTWTALIVGYNLNQIIFVSWLNMFIVLTGSAGAYKTSTDGSIWINRNFPIPVNASLGLNSFNDVGNKIIGLGFYYNIYSLDGINWVPRYNTVINSTLNSSAIDSSNSILAVGNSSLIQVSPGV